MDIFSPPTPTGPERAKPPLCGAREGLATCTLYRDHAADFHRDQHEHQSWPVEPDPALVPPPPVLNDPNWAYNTCCGRCGPGLCYVDEMTGA